MFAQVLHKFGDVYAQVNLFNTKSLAQVWVIKCKKTYSSGYMEL